MNINVEVVKITTQETVHNENNSVQEKDVTQTIMEEVSLVRKVSFILCAINLTRHLSW